jgi:hypothetical protein
MRRERTQPRGSYKMGDLKRTRVELDPLLFSSANRIRTPGLHLTDVVKDLLTKAGIGRKYRSAEAGGYNQEQLDKFALQGFLWEDVFSYALAHRLCGTATYIRLPEIAYNPITRHAFWIHYDDSGRLLTPVPKGYFICSPDGGRIQDEFFHSVAEFKWTTMSANMQPDTDKPEWFWQVRGYMGAISDESGYHVGRAEWHVHFCRGDYKGGSPPMYEQWEREYSVGEVEDTWSALSNHALWTVKNDPNHPWGRWLL